MFYVSDLLIGSYDIFGVAFLVLGNGYKEKCKKERYIMASTKGLEGIVAAETKISSIIDDTLTYVGYNIDDLTNNATFEEEIGRAHV